MAAQSETILALWARFDRVGELCPFEWHKPWVRFTVSPTPVGTTNVPSPTDTLASCNKIRAQAIQMKTRGGSMHQCISRLMQPANTLSSRLNGLIT
jgi:hypothetical protein